MGDIAEMMIGGDLCQYCGVAMPEGGDGYPQSCGSCSQDEKEQRAKDKRQRFEHVKASLAKNGFPFKVCSQQNFHIKVGEWNFWAWTGKIYHPNIKLEKGQDDRGLGTFIKHLKKHIK